MDIVLEQEEFTLSDKVAASVICFLIQFPGNFGWLGLIQFEKFGGDPLKRRITDQVQLVNIIFLQKRTWDKWQTSIILANVKNDTSINVSQHCGHNWNFDEWGICLRSSPFKDLQRICENKTLAFLFTFANWNLSDKIVAQVPKKKVDFHGWTIHTKKFEHDQSHD